MSYNQKHYKSWTVSDTVEWIISLNPRQFEKYRSTLTSSLTKINFNGSCINDLDREDLKQYGIINLSDRKTIYKSIITLMATQKRRDSQIKDDTLILSLSDDDSNNMTKPKRNYSTLLSEQQLNSLSNKGYCKMHNDETDNKLLMYLITGWIRLNYNGIDLIIDIIHAIIYLHGPKFDINIYIQLQSCEEEYPTYYLTTKQNIEISGLLCLQPGPLLECRQVPSDTLQHVLLYLGHHKGIEPDPLPCPVRSIHMSQIVSDKWDAIFIDSFDKKTIFEIILAANYMDIKTLVHLGAAKIATLIKQLDQQEINRIIEEEERYRREQAEKQREKEQESVFGLNEQNDNGDNNGDGNNGIKGLDEDDKE